MFFLLVQTGLGSLFFIPELNHAFADVLNLGLSPEGIRDLR